jgi:RNA polymerase sigma factor (sigma-70 family)
LYGIQEIVVPGRSSAIPVASAAPAPEVESSTQLLLRAQEGDADARNTLFARYVPVLQRFARGRLPRWARDARDTGDLVQDSLLQTLKHIGSFRPSRDGALQAYLRQAVMNRIRDEIRKAGRRPKPATVPDVAADHASPLEEAIGQQALQRYEEALARLRAEDREAIIGRIELGYGYDELAGALDKPTAGAARLAVARALVKLAEEMERHG